MIDLPLASDIQPGEDFTRFILTQKHYSVDKKRVKPPALLPMLSATTNRWETSTHRVQGLPVAEIWNLGYEHVENRPASRIIKARGQGSFDLAKSAGLSLDVNGPPYPRHVDLIGWSPTDKDVRLMKATEIADKLLLVIDPRT